MNKKALVLVIALAVVAAGAIVYFSVLGGGESDGGDDLLVPTAAADVYEDNNRLEVLTGSAQITRASGADETMTGITDVNVGDTIKISDDGKAILYWFDHSISRLSGGTELTIDQAAYNPENINEADINFEVVSGEVWSKVQAIVDEDSEFLSYSGAVVAGVRGSVYNFAVSGDEVVVDSIAHALVVGDETLTSGEEGSFKKDDGEKLSQADIDSKTWGRAWFQENLVQDTVDRERMMAAMMAKIRRSIGALPGEPGFMEKIEKMDEFMKSDAAPKKKKAVEAKIVALVRAMDILPSDKLYPIKVMLQEKLIEWATDKQTRDFMMKKNIERRLYSLYDWLKDNDPSMEELKAYLVKFRDLMGGNYVLFDENPDLIRLVRRIIALIQQKMPGITEEAEFLRIIEGLNGAEEPEFRPIIRSAPVWNVKPPVTTEPRDTILEEAPFYRGESNV